MTFIQWLKYLGFKSSLNRMKNDEFYNKNPYYNIGITEMECKMNILFNLKGK